MVERKSLYDEALELLDVARTRGLTREEVASATGTTTHWLAKFATGGIQNPGIRRIERMCSGLQALLYGEPEHVGRPTREDFEMARRFGWDGRFTSLEAAVAAIRRAAKKAEDRAAYADGPAYTQDMDQARSLSRTAERLSPALRVGACLQAN